jgi:predicted transcriptional regulator of viral defense system
MVAHLARHFHTGYYVGWLTAAARYGAAHHAPQVFQVAAERTVAARVAGRVRFEFHRRERAGSAPTTAMRSSSGDVRFSTPALTALDVAADLRLAGGLDNAASVIVDLVGEAGLTGDQVADTAPWRPLAAVRRAGWIMDNLAGASALGQLRRAARPDQGQPALLDPSGPRRGHANQAWGLIANADVDVDT